MTSFWKFLSKILRLNTQKKNKDSSKEKQYRSEAVIALDPDIEAHKLFDCVMLEDRYSEVQNLVRDNTNPDFDVFYDLGIIIGSSPKLDSEGIPYYYIVSWYNPRTPEKPVLKKIEHSSLIPVIRPISDLNDRSEYLNRMFRAFFMNWLDLYNHDDATKN